MTARAGPTSRQGHAGLEHGEHHRAFALRRGERLHGGGSPQTRRFEAPHLPDARFRQELDTIVDGIPDGANAHSVREDPKHRGLLFAGTELGVYYSPDDGAHWHPLQLNLPVTPVHDLAIKDNDLWRPRTDAPSGSWTTSRRCARLPTGWRPAHFTYSRPAHALKLHFPGEVERRLPVGDNPPSGAVIDYYLKSKPAEDEEITLEISPSTAKWCGVCPIAGRGQFEQPAEWTDREKSEDTIPSRGRRQSLHLGPAPRGSGENSRRFLQGRRAQGTPGNAGQLSGSPHRGSKSQTEPLEVVQDPRLGQDFRPGRTRTSARVA